MNNQPFVSVIVPIYNVEQYIRKCIESLLNQTYSNYEIILVDDGSPDNCGIICDEYKLISEKISVLHLENGGVCRARNMGMDIAKGEYFCFVDSDDWVEENFLEDFITFLDKDDTMIIQDCIRDLPNKSERDFFNFQTKSYDFDEQIVDILKDGFFQEGFPWNKIYSKKIIYDNNLRFDPAIKLGDDEKWNLQYYPFVKKMIFVKKANYHYQYNPNSISNQARPFERELLRFIFRAEFFYNIISKNIENVHLKKVLSNHVESFFRISIFDRLYKNKLTKKERVEKLREISKLPSDYLSLLTSDLKYRNFDYDLLRKGNVKLMDTFKMLRLKLR